MHETGLRLHTRLAGAVLVALEKLGGAAPAKKLQRSRGARGKTRGVGQELAQQVPHGVVVHQRGVVAGAAQHNGGGGGGEAAPANGSKAVPLQRSATVAVAPQRVEAEAGGRRGRRRRGGRSDPGGHGEVAAREVLVLGAHDVEHRRAAAAAPLADPSTGSGGHEVVLLTAPSRDDAGIQARFQLGIVVSRGQHATLGLAQQDEPGVGRDEGRDVRHKIIQFALPKQENPLVKLAPPSRVRGDACCVCRVAKRETTTSSIPVTRGLVHDVASPIAIGERRAGRRQRPRAPVPQAQRRGVREGVRHHHAVAQRRHFGDPPP
mmetsp:Transcript_57592/g.187120  ORF Transcript_57592/g.187120 Transcript_57592/m.187120 type:complete len:320 (-) Transcript_57592:359-1318(-)